MKNFIEKYVIIFIPIILAGSSSLFFSSDLTNIVMPPGSLSPFAFPIVWSILYLLMGFSLYLIRNNVFYIKLFSLQLIINLSWSFIFFNLNMYFLSLIIIFLLIMLVFYMLIKFNETNKKAMLLNIPYFIWLLIAYYLASGIYILN